MQKALAVALLEGYPGVQVNIDSTGVGDPIAQDLRNLGLNIWDVIFTPRKKQELVENLVVALEQDYLGIPDQQETQWLLEELRQYQAVRMPSGALRYGAPEGRFDDGVTALMLAASSLAGQWRQPQLEEVIQPSWWERDDAHWEWLEYEHQVRRFHDQFPSEPVPIHPTDWAWSRMSAGARN